jgi:hypothetical protein
VRSRNLQIPLRNEPALTVPGPLEAHGMRRPSRSSQVARVVRSRGHLVRLFMLAHHGLSSKAVIAGVVHAFASTMVGLLLYRGETCTQRGPEHAAPCR